MSVDFRDLYATILKQWLTPGLEIPFKHDRADLPIITSV
jgi:hypothetical protein